ncbi:MAG: family 78 glycoside hydrolase catalytic domain, partial [Clostridia bacterium]|nr:family 78 glycoside hydrolase catalytic domain [Clostridia bacterium]
VACESACLFVCGLGYHKAYINGQEVFGYPLNPAFSEYEKRAYYSVIPLAGKYLKAGLNRLSVRVASGWRNPELICYTTGHCTVAYSGKTVLSALLRFNMGASGITWLLTDESWRVYSDAVTQSDLFMGETFDARNQISGWAYAGTRIDRALLPERTACPTLHLTPQTLEPVKPQEVYPTRSVTSVGDDVWLVDFGQNIAGVCRLKIPRGIAPGTKIVLHHSEFLDEEGRLYLPQLRHADSVDTYIAAGDGRDPEYWQCEFTYHGFRYAEVSGYHELLRKEDIYAVSLHTDAEKASTFVCGEPRVNAFAHIARQTEKANIHSILTDCPQRDERMGWLNDATVRFEATPYLFDVGRLFPKVVRDIMDIQGEDGSITCTAPFAFGSRPADPVCSSFLVAGWQAWLHTGNSELLREAYPAFRAWNDCLEKHSQNGIVQYSHYGDWAGPAYACEDMENAHSKVTPGILMSSGYHYYNAVLLSKMAHILGDEAEQRKQQEDAERIRAAFLSKWYDPVSGKVATGSQGCQAFALWLNILPEEGREKAARLMRDDLVRNEYRFTTGNLCTRYLIEQLARYGYADEAWELLLRQDYPSFGYMMQNEATTVWERFELKKNCGMNSHNHPMHASSYRWLYAGLCGLEPTDGVWRRFSARPVMPSKLLSASATVETPLGDVTLRWIRRYGEAHVYLTVPHGAQADVELPWGEKQTLGEGFHHFSSQQMG